MTVVCAFTGIPGDCQECGGHDPTGTGFCSHDCRAARADREARHEAERQAQRENEAAFAAAVDQLRERGHSDEEIDDILKGWP